MGVARQRRSPLDAAQQIARDACRRGEIVDLRVFLVQQILETAPSDLATLERAYAVLGDAVRDARARRAGRPKGSGVLPRARLLGRVARIAEQLWREHANGPTLGIVAREVGYSEDGLRRALKRRGIDWREVRTDTERRVSVGFRSEWPPEGPSRWS